jgi:hypothetical protein
MNKNSSSNYKKILKTFLTSDLTCDLIGDKNVSVTPTRRAGPVAMSRPLPSSRLGKLPPLCAEPPIKPLPLLPAQAVGIC